MNRVLVLNGPNLNKLGSREPDIYGHETLSDIENACRAEAQNYDLDIDFRQSNSEAQLIDWVQDLPRETRAVIINAAGYTHSSVALHDALKLLDVPVIEVHLSNPGARESFRHISYITPVASGVISGFGSASYTLAVKAIATLLDKNKQH